MKQRMSILLCSVFLLCLSVSAAEPVYILQQHENEICWYDIAADRWHPTGCPADTIGSSADRALLADGLPLYSRAELTRALEDFCS